MKIFTVTKNDASQRLDRFITKNCPELPAALMFKYIRIKRIKVNGKRAQINTRLSEGDTVEDAAGCWVFPGFIDGHTHMQCWTGMDWTADSFETGTRCWRISRRVCWSTRTKTNTEILS